MFNAQIDKSGEIFHSKHTLACLAIHTVNESASFDEILGNVRADFPFELCAYTPRDNFLSLLFKDGSLITVRAA